MASEISVTAFFEKEEQSQAPLYPSQLNPLRTALQDHSAPIVPLATAIAQPMLQSFDRFSRNIEDDFEGTFFWRVVQAAIEQMPSQIDRLVELVVAITRVPDPTGYLPQLDHMRQSWNEFACDFIPPQPFASDPAERQRKRLEWINMNAFNAKTSTFGVKALDQRDRSGRVFRKALEETPWVVDYVQWMEEAMDDEEDDREDPDVVEWREKELAKRDIRMLDYWVPAAAAWIEYDAKGIYLAMENEPIPRNDSEPSAWKGSDVFSKERFRFWKERFIWASRVTALAHDTRRRAASAADIMEAVIEGNRV